MLSYNEYEDFIETLTLQETAVLHRDLWNWIYEESLRIGHIVSKSSYFRTFDKWFPIWPDHNCWFCQYVCDLTSNFPNNLNECFFCPGEWRSNLNLCYVGSIYQIYSNNVGSSPISKEVLQAIQQICDIPIRWEMFKS